MKVKRTSNLLRNLLPQILNVEFDERSFSQVIVGVYKYILAIIYSNSYYCCSPCFSKICDELGIKKVYEKILIWVLESDSARVRRLALKQKRWQKIRLIATGSFRHIETLLDKILSALQSNIDLEIKICKPYQCSCGRGVDSYVCYGFLCVRSAGWIYI